MATGQSPRHALLTLKGATGGPEFVVLWASAVICDVLGMNLYESLVSWRRSRGNEKKYIFDFSEQQP